MVLVVVVAAARGMKRRAREVSAMDFMVIW
jgi:hypothetical protein